MKIAVFGTTVGSDFLTVLKRFFGFYAQHGVEIHIFRAFYDHLLNDFGYQPEVKDFFTGHNDFDETVKLIFSIGGDGTFLQSFNNTRSFHIPLVGLNSGRLGFLADISQESDHHALTHILEGKYSTLERTLLEVELSGDAGFEFNYALNEATVLKTDSSSMIHIHSRINGEFLNEVWADGLIVATPTGSTAYSLSVGGPIVSPDSQNFVINPIAPHNLTVRPIIVPDTSQIELTIDGRGSHYLASLDSRFMNVLINTRVVIRKAPFTLKTLQLPDQSFYQTLRNKLLWSHDKRN